MRLLQEFTNPCCHSGLRFVQTSGCSERKFYVNNSGLDDAGARHDHTILEQLYDCPARYLGMLGSKLRMAKLWHTLAAKGIARQWLERVHAPIGFNIHAQSPEEISISILAELIHVRRTSPVVIPQRQCRSS